MTVYQVVFFMFTIVTLEKVVIASDVAKCECGVFKFPTANATNEVPILAKALQFNFECNTEEKESCSNMCKALAEASKEGPKRICEVLKDTVDPLVPAIYYRACDDNTWRYTGLKSTFDICCKNKELISCS